MGNLLTIKNLKKHFHVSRGIFDRHGSTVYAVDGVGLSVKKGETFGLVGESGCGKSTLARVVMRLIEPTGGSIIFDGRDISSLSQREMIPIRRKVQMIFQDPYASLNPRMTVGDIIGEALIIHKLAESNVQKNNIVAKLMDVVGLPKDSINRYPHEFSGGQRQRVGIARALAVKPDLIIADEPISALDVSIQAQILNLLQDLQKEFNLTYLFIAHDLRVVEYISDRIAVMYLGKIVELGNASDVYNHPVHPYTESLLSSIPILGTDLKSVPTVHKKKKRIILKGDIPSPMNPPSGCAFHTRCIYAQERCKIEAPLLTERDGRVASCHFPL
ncbi:MAG: dipeptide ABC transporter ATP-binding protein [Deltaproteobacteria bacterium]|nr:dipeptide ABC transporter ATP-binding protein [Deltaproteobacteria bacterium]